MFRTLWAACAVWIFQMGIAVADEPVAKARPVRTGEVRFEPTPKEESVPALFQLQPHAFAFEQAPLETVSTTIEIFDVRFPSAVETEEPANNTVHTEYFRPAGEGRRPAVVVLHILGGDFDLARLFCRRLASSGVAALFLKMPYYGPRRTPGSSARMISDDPQSTVDGMRQAVLDIRRGAAWLAAQQEVDPQQLGVFGISLGGITSALAASAEPRFAKVCTMLAGGDLGKVSWDRPELSRIRDRWIAKGHTKEEFVGLLEQVDPVTHLAPVEGRRVLMLNAAHDEVIPRESTDALWNAFGKPDIVWYDAGHYSALLHVFDGLGRVAKFFQAEGQE